MVAKKRVIVARIDLFKTSEPFIVDQARAHVEYEPVFVGVNELGPRPNWARTVLTSQKDELRSLLDDDVPTVVHAHFAIDGFLGMRLAKRANAPLAVTLHGFDVTRSRSAFLKSGRPNLMKYAAGQRIIQRSARKFLAVSGAIREAALAAGFPEDRTCVHHLGVPLGEKHGVADLSGALKIVHVARLVEKKGTEYLLRAMKPLVENHPSSRLVIVGDGPLRQHLSALSDSLGIADNVEFLGALPHDETLKRIADANVVCLPSIKGRNGETEGLPITILEGARFGLPIITTSNGGIGDFLRNGVNGLQVPERDSASLAAALLRLAGDESERAALGATALATVGERFDVQIQTQKLERILDDLL